MSTGWEEVWVTFIQNDGDIINAMILAKSLKLTYTHRKLLALHGDDVSHKGRMDLATCFDGLMLVQIPKKLQWMENDLETYSKIHCWSLPVYQKCVFLKSKSVVLENCDTFFNNNGIAISGKKHSKSIISDLDLIILEPSQKMYLNLVDKMLEQYNSAGRTNGVNAETYFKKCLVASSQLNLFEPTCYTTFPEIESIQGKSRTPPRIRLYHSANNTQRANLDQKTAVDFYKSLFNEVEHQLADVNNRKLLKSFPNSENEPIAIVGMACRVPGANTLEEFWDLMMNYGDGIQQLPADRWTSEQFCFLEKDTKIYQAGFLKAPVDEFDAKFFEMSPLEVSFTDPQHRIMMEVMWEALEDACITPVSLRGRYVGIFTGSWTYDYRDLLIQSKVKQTEFYRSYMGTSIGTLAGRLAHFLGITGPNIGTESGCSSSMVAVGLALKSLRNKELNLALVGGVNLLLSPFCYSDVKNICSPDMHCKTFDESADGFGRADGCGVLVLKRLSDAIREGDRIHALIKGYGAAQEGPSKSMGTPTVQCEALAMNLALKDANVHPSEVSFVEAHGTGTAVGDPLEIKAITDVYSEGRISPLMIGSVKSNIGHTESTSGIISIIKTVLAFQNEIIPPLRSLKKLNSLINLEKIPAIIPTTPVIWERKNGQPMLAGVSSFGITGTDAHVILQEAPPLISAKCVYNTISETSSVNILTVSAKSAEALDELLARYKTLLEDNKSDIAADIAYTSNVGRSHFLHRVVITGQTNQDILKTLQGGNFEKSKIIVNQPKLCFLYTGQGSQYYEMGKTLYKYYPCFKFNFDTCDEILKSLYNISIQNALWDDESKKMLHTSLYSQASIFVIEYCLTKLWEEWGIKPDCVLGHSLGEFAAATAAGILSLQDALKLVGERSKLIDQISKGGMLVVKASEEMTQQLISNFLTKTNDSYWIDIAAVNTLDQTTIASTAEGVNAFNQFCQNNNLKTHLLDATHAFHSRDMDSILERYRSHACGIKFGQPKCKFISGVSGKLVDTVVDSEYWVQHTREAVRFKAASIQTYEMGYRVFIEIGPQPVLSALLRRNIEEIQNSQPSEAIFCHPSMKKGTSTDEVTVILDALRNVYLKGVHINWKGFHMYSNRKLVSLPFYPFQRKKYWFNAELNYHLHLENNTNQIHPLVGSALEVQAENTIFQTFLNTKKIPYVLDHMVGEHVILPAACYIEMLLVAGYAAQFPAFEEFSLPATPIVLENFTIKMPLEFLQGNTYEIQTIVSNLENAENDLPSTTVCAYSRARGILKSKSVNWKFHTKANFRVSNFSEDNIIKRDYKNLQQTTLVTLLEDTYSNLTTLGYNFGPIFQSVRKVWRNSEEFLAQVELKDPELSKHFCHPVLIDAMIQAILMATSTNIESLHLPIAIQKFVFFTPPKSGVNLVHVFSEESSAFVKTAILMDESGEVLAIMKGLELVKTNLTAIERSLGESKSTILSIYNEHWRPSEFSQISKKSHTPHLTSFVPTMNGRVKEIFENYITNDNEFNTFIGLGVLKAFMEIGWSNPNVGDVIEVKSLMKKFNILDGSCAVLRRMLNMLVEDSYLTELIEQDCFKVEQKFPSVAQLSQELTKFYESPIASTGAEWEIAYHFFKMLPEILTGKLSILSVLFPEKASVVSAERTYKECSFTMKSNVILEKCTDSILERLAKKPKTASTSVLRILEIGAGTGSATKRILPLLKKHNVKYMYDFTDISAAFFKNAKLSFQEDVENMNFFPLNIENDPKMQGFAPHQYDLVIASNVLHATQNLKETCTNIRHLIKPRGIIMIFETLIPQRFLDIMFGHLDGYWRFTDFDLRENHCVIDETKWGNVLESTGFPNTISYKLPCGGYGVVISQASDTSRQQYVEPTSSKTRNYSKLWLVFTDDNDFFKNLSDCLQLLGKTAIAVRFNMEETENDINDFGINTRAQSPKDMEKVFELTRSAYPTSEVEGILFMWGINTFVDTHLLTKTYLFLLQTIIRFHSAQTPKLYLITQGQVYINDDEPQEPVAATLLGMTRCFRSEYPSVPCVSIDLDSQTDKREQVDEIISELWKHDKEPLIAFRQGVRHVARINTPKDGLEFSPLSLPSKCNQRFALILPASKSIADLKFGYFPSKKLGENEIEVLVKAAALNFRDVFSVLKPSAEFDNVNWVGGDFSGIIQAVGSAVKDKKVGDAVLGCNFLNDALPSHIMIHENHVALLPDHMTFAEGATLTCAYATSYESLIAIAKLVKDETILIHTASGGVGCCAVQMALNIGATVIATAGSRRKRAYLRSLGVKHIFNSRDHAYGKQVLQATNGLGVDVLLNSLTGPGFIKTSLDCCNTNARFIEMSRLNIWTEEEVKVYRPDVQYTIIDLSSANSDKPYTNMMKVLNESIKSKQILPLSCTIFDALRIRDALTYLQKAKHVGKVVCVWPEINSLNNVVEIKSKLFNDRSTYLITGGLQGIGLEVARWMSESGAKYIVLCGRSKPSEDSLTKINELISLGINIHIIQADVGNYNECQALLNTIKDDSSLNLPPLRGIMHSAGCLSDAVIPNQTDKTFEITMNPKVNGGWNLHMLTKHCNLEHFVLFSSISAIFGNTGQSNHCASNSYLDTLANYRHAIGLPATSINWGLWGETGIAADMKQLARWTSFSTRKGIKTLQHVMENHYKNIMAYDLDHEFWKNIHLFPWAKLYVEEVRIKFNQAGQTSSSQTKAGMINPAEFWKEFSAAKDPDQQINFIQKHLSQMLSSNLKLEKDDKIDMHQNLQELGMDSLMMIEFKNQIQMLLGSKHSISPDVITSSPTLHLLSNKLMEIIFSNGSEKPEST